VGDRDIRVSTAGCKKNKHTHILRRDVKQALLNNLKHKQESQRGTSKPKKYLKKRERTRLREIVGEGVGAIRETKARGRESESSKRDRGNT
jgi:hypothetical protein